MMIVVVVVIVADEEMLSRVVHVDRPYRPRLLPMAFSPKKRGVPCLVQILILTLDLALVFVFVFVLALVLVLDHEILPLRENHNLHNLLVHPNFHPGIDYVDQNTEH